MELLFSRIPWYPNREETERRITMKRLILIALTLALALSLAACGSAPAPTEPPLFAPDAPTEAPATEPAPTAPAEMPTEAPADYTLSGLTIVDNDKCAFTVTGTEFNEHLGLQIQVLCENKSDRTLMFSWNNVSVCGFMYDPMWAEEVAPGKKVNTTIGIDTYALEQMKVESVDQIEFDLWIQDSEEFMNEPVVNESFSIYPTGKTAETVRFPVFEPSEEDTVIVDNGDLTFIVMNVDDELADYYTLNCYIANKSDKNLMITWDEVSVNGFMVNPFWAMSVAAGKQAYTEIIFYRSDLQEQDIEVVQNIEFRLQASDNDNWEADFILDEVYTFKPSQ